jgi:acyl-CoA dehydrogenase
MAMTRELDIPEDIRDLVKGISEGLLQFVEQEVVPLEERDRDILGDERKLFDEHGYLVPRAQEARQQIRQRSAQAGYYAMYAPESVGGGGVPPRAMSLIQERYYRHIGPGRLYAGWARAFLTAPPIASFVDGPSHIFTFAPEEVRKEFLPALLRGEKTVCFALSEPDAGSDVWGLKTRAVRDGDEWVISGTKQWITNAPYADYAIVFAVTDEEMAAQHRGGITAFFVDTSSPGFQRQAVIRIMGHLGSDCGIISLDGVRVPHSRVMGEVNQGFQIAMLGISEGRVSIAASCVGLAEYALDRALAYAQERKAFGVPIAEHQAIQFMLADMAIDIFTSKYACLQTAALVEAAVKGQTRIPVKEISIVKAYCVEACQRAFDAAIQIHGGVGLTDDLPLNEGWRIARTLRIPDGTSEIQRRTIARQMLRGDTAF